VIACFNVATLVLARAVPGRASSRKAGSGSEPDKIDRQMMAENLLVATIGGILGAGVALLGSQALIALAGEGRPLSMTVRWT